MTSFEQLEDFGTSPGRNESREEYLFANVQSLDSSTSYLNHALQALGIPTFQRTGDEKASLVGACNSIYGLLQLHHAERTSRESLLEQQHRLLTEIKLLDAKLERTKVQLTTKESELQSQFSKETKTNANHRAQVEKLQAERDEFQRLAQAAQQVRTQQAYELRKREKEYARLQERLSAQLADKKERSRASIEVIKPVQKEGRQRATWGGKPDEADFYHKLVDVYEAKKVKLLEENEDLKATLRAVQQEVRRLVSPNNEIEPQLLRDEEGSTQEMYCDDGQTDMLNMPYHLTKEAIEASLQQDLSAIRERLEEAAWAELHPETSMQLSGSVTANDRSQENRSNGKMMRKPSSMRLLLQQLDEERQAVRKLAVRLDEETVRLAEVRNTLSGEQVVLAASRELWSHRISEQKSEELSNDLDLRESRSSAKNGPI